MAKRIQLLEPLLSNQIAAGEVIERPAAVVKELVENSLDAGATRITVEVEQGGIKLIRVRDNGEGIVKEDLSLALARHATSKLHTINDLQAIQSLGFRGEALASIASVSDLCISSRHVHANQAWRIHNTLEPIAHPQGTTVDMHELFYNTPARRKFLRSIKTESFHIEETLKRIGLSRMDVALDYYCDGKRVWQLGAVVDEASRLKRIKKICGATFVEHGIFFDESNEDLQLKGWVCPAEYTRSSTDVQYFYVNNRVVRDKLITHAVKQAYQEYLHPGRQPLYLLYLNLDPKTVDVNVHPTKHEVRFSQARAVHDFIVQSVQRHVAAPKPVPQQRDYVTPLQTRTPDNEIGRYLSCVGQRFILLEHNSEVLLIDYHHACYDLNKRFLATQTDLAGFDCLVPATLKVPDTEKIMHCQALWQNYGLNIDTVDAEHVILRATPLLLKSISPQTLLQKLCAHCPDSQTQLVEFIARVSAQIDPALLGEAGILAWCQTLQESGYFYTLSTTLSSSMLEKLLHA